MHQSHRKMLCVCMFQASGCSVEFALTKISRFSTIALQDEGLEAPLQGTLPRWDFSTGPGLRSHQLATLRSMPSGDLPARTASGTVVEPVRSSARSA